MKDQVNRGKIPTRIGRLVSYIELAAIFFNILTKNIVCLLWPFHTTIWLLSAVHVSYKSRAVFYSAEKRRLSPRPFGLGTFTRKRSAKPAVVRKYTPTANRFSRQTHPNVEEYRNNLVQ